MNEKEFNGLILAELVKIANDVFTNEIEIAPGTYTAAELAKLKDANGNEIYSVFTTNYSSIFYKQ